MEFIGIKAVQSVLKNATQSNLSMFHQAGNISSDILPKASIKDLLNGSKKYSSYSSATITTNDMTIRRKFIYKRFKDFILNFSLSKFISVEDHIGRCIYDHKGINPPDSFMRFYLDPKKFIPIGYTLEEIANIVFDNCNFYVSPNFMGIIDVSNDSRFKVLSLDFILDTQLGGYLNVQNAIISDSKIFLFNSCIESMLLENFIVKNTIISNDIYDVEKHFGIETAKHVMIDLMSNDPKDNNVHVMVNYMTRSGTIIPLKNDNLSRYKKGFITDISFERARDTLISYLSNDNYSTTDSIKSVKAKIWAGTMGNF